MSEKSDLRLEFYNNVFQRLENRMEMLDNRVNIFLALAVGLLIGFSYAVEGIFPSGSKSAVVSVGYGSIVASSLFTLVVCLFFVQTIRPTKWFLGAHTDLGDPPLCENFIMFPEPDMCPGDRLSPEEFVKRFDSIDEKSIIDNYRRTIYILTHQLHNKHKFYRNSVRLFKVLFIFDAVLLMGLVISFLA